MSLTNLEASWLLLIPNPSHSAPRNVSRLTGFRTDFLVFSTHPACLNFALSTLTKTWSLA
ncbi:hypothetical protein BpHYR1_016053 [Brachionus plicatilis]|uniref:Uncharacterized protein n=1 Tax=Brachionus plicatilis TaxID=10195 RepID=A0A3M7RS81_BRAPC|nr:hypothetical protein BpHYR1_016053 [Brachionus plicatilis]